MKKLVLCVGIFFLLIGIMYANAVSSTTKEKPLYANNKLKIQLNQEAYNIARLPQGLYTEASSFNINELDQLMKQIGGVKIIRAHIRMNDLAYEQKTGFDRWFLIKLDGKVTVENAIKALKANRYIEESIPEYYAYTTAVPNDTYYANNWGHNNTAQLPYYTGGSHSGAGVGTIGFDADMQLAWDQSQGYGSASIIIAIIDTGVDLTHPDLRLVTGYDYGDNDSDPSDNSASPNHGTACSGVAAAKANNGLGITGAAGGCSVMPIKIANSAGSLEFTAIENALVHAGDNNVDIASMSFGAEGGMAEGDSPSTDTALEYAYSHGVTLLAATANSNTSAIAYPSNHNKVISVGAASPTGQRKSTTSSDGENWWGSNYGSATIDAQLAVDIMAPTILPSTDRVGSVGYSTTDYYMWFNGTSCATPYAAGCAALLISKDPSLTPAQVRTALTSTATDMTFDGGAGWDRYTGYGMVNANAALNSLIPGMPACTITAPLGGSVYDLNSTITVNVTATDTDGTITSVAFYIDDVLKNTDTTAPYSWSWNTTGYSGGAHTIKAIATDNSSNTAQSTVTVTLLAPPDEGFETGNFSAFAWDNSSAIPWTVQSTEKFSGTYAAKSGAIGDNASTTLNLPMNITSAGNISFWQKVSSESGYDYLRFYIDSVQQGQWSGAGSWTSQTYAVTTGNHTFTWTYSKDTNTVSGSDCAWLDHIIFPPHVVLTPANITWNPTSFTQNLLTNQTASQTLNIGNTGTQNLTYTASLPTGTTTVLDETFATTGIPTGWTETLVSGTALSWVYATGGGYSNTHPAAAYDGTYNARLYKTSTTASVVKLITPVMDLSGATSATLTFWHTQELWSPDQDELGIYYKTSLGGSWTNLATYTSSIAAWTMETISLPSLNGTYYIAFEGTAKYGYGVCVDKVVVTKQTGAAPTWLTLNSGTSVTNTISGIGSNNITVGFNSTGLSTGTYNSTITVNSNSVSNPSVSIPVTLNVTSGTPSIVVNPTSLPFGTVRINTTAASNFTITNSGTAPLSGNITTPTGYTVALAAREAVSSPDSDLKSVPPEKVAQRNTLPYTVAAGSAANFTVTFAPTAVQAYNGNITITHNAGGADKTITLTGQGGKPTLGLSATTFNASLAPGGNSSQTLTVSNTGNMTLNYSLTISGSPAWLTINGGTTVSNSIVSGGAAQPVTLGFNASGMSPGSYNATLNGTSNDPSNPTYAISVALTVLIPITVSSPAGGENWQGGTSHNIVWNYSGTGTNVTLAYSTNGGGSWTSLGVQTSGQGTNNYAWTVPNVNSANCKVKVTDSIAPNYEAISNTFSLSSPVIVVSVASLSFGAVVVNTTSQQSFTINNTGNATLIGSITTPAGYTVASATRDGQVDKSTLKTEDPQRNTFGYSIAGGLSRIFNLTFAPTSVASYNGNVVITSNDSAHPTVNIALTGNGFIPPTISIDNSSLNASLTIAEVDTDIFTISNSGSQDLTFSISESPAVAWFSAAPLAGTISASGSRLITGSFTAAGLAPGIYQTLLLVASNDPVHPLLEVSVALEVLNSLPTIDLPASFAFDLNGSLVVDFTPFVNDVNGQTLSLGYSGNTNVLVSIDGLNVTFTAAAGWYGSEGIAFSVYDGYAYEYDTVTVNVILANLATPVISTIGRSAGGVTIQWNRVDYAIEYYIYASINPYSDFTYLNTTTELFYEIATDLPYKFFYVKAVNNSARSN
jgi:subtilisin family serine protease